MDEAGEDTSISAVPNALVLFNPALALAPFPGLDSKGFEKNQDPERFGCPPEAISPLHHVGGHMPPTLILHGRADTTVPFASAEAFAAEMTKKGNRCDLVGYEGQTHGIFQQCALRRNRGRGRQIPCLARLPLPAENNTVNQPLLRQRLVLRLRQKANKHETDEEQPGHQADGYAQIHAWQALQLAGKDEHASGEQTTSIEAEACAGRAQVVGKEFGEIDGVTRMDAEGEEAVDGQHGEEHAVGSGKEAGERHENEGAKMIKDKRPTPAQADSQGTEGEHAYSGAQRLDIAICRLGTISGFRECDSVAEQKILGQILAGDRHRPKRAESHGRE
jgi:hypothetical protein